MTQKRVWILFGAGLLLIVALIVNHNVCLSAWLKYRIWMKDCPDGRIHQTLAMSANGLRRGAPGTVTLSAFAHYTVHDADDAVTVPVTSMRLASVALVDANNKETPLAVNWTLTGDSYESPLTLPEVPDGDYKLRAKMTTRVGEDQMDLPLGLYTPARVHVITDRPLYEPGNVVKFRAVVLRARDLAPLDNRPGVWMIKDPSGEVLLEEKAPAGDWGVVAGSFPLDAGADTGTWHVSWVSNDAQDEIPFTVEPFTLPRFRVEASTQKPFYSPGEKPVMTGAVVYSSGAPVAGAMLDISWQVAGAWPPPLDWEDKLLPKKAQTGPNGRFELALPQIPSDLQGQATLTARISAVDPAGDRVEGAGQVLLSQDAIQVQAVTELQDGLVQGFNNRMYLRVTTADGRPLPKSKIKVVRAWEPTDKGIEAEVDEDGVASLQIDPGGPVNVVIPPEPWRPAKKIAVVTRDEIEDLLGEEGASLADQVEMDKWLGALTPCAKWVESAESARVGMRIDPGGAIVTVGAGPTPLDACVVSIVKTKRLPAGGERMYAVGFTFQDPQLPSMSDQLSTASGEPPPGLEEELGTLSRSVRDCLPEQNDEGALPKALMWHGHAGSKDVDFGWIKDPKGGPAAAAMACVEGRLPAKIALKDPAPQDGLGLVRFDVSLPVVEGQERPQATTMLGYELMVTAEIDGSPKTLLRLTPGTVPDLRLRVTPVLAKPGDTVTAELIRGPDFTGELPKELAMDHLKGHATAPLDDDHKAKFTIDPKAEGWVEITGAGQRALVYVRPAAELAVSLKAKSERYAPGERAELQLLTTVGGKGGKAAVGLIGVDESLGQLVTLPGPGDMGRVRPQVGTSSMAFNVLDGQALTLGRIRGANAAAATVLRVTTIPGPPQLDAVVNASGTSTFDPSVELTDHFYVVLEELHVQTELWESQAPKSEKMRPATMARLWSHAVEVCTKRGDHVEDAFGRKLRLSLLPPDLLALTDPRVVVVEGTRLPEDVENWTAWVAKEKP